MGGERLTDCAESARRSVLLGLRDITPQVTRNQTLMKETRIKGKGKRGTAIPVCQCGVCDDRRTATQKDMVVYIFLSTQVEKGEEALHWPRMSWIKAGNESQKFERIVQKQISVYHVLRLATNSKKAGKDIPGSVQKMLRRERKQGGKEFQEVKGAPNV